MAFNLILPGLLLIVLLIGNGTAHFPPQCRCVCHTGRTGFSRAKGDCFRPGAGHCFLRLCRLFDQGGFSCCMPDPSPFPVPELGTPLPKPSMAPGHRSVAGSMAPMSMDGEEVEASSTDASHAEASQTALVSSFTPLPSVAPFSPDTAIISFAGADEVELIVNGASVATLLDWTMVGSVQRELHSGDVVGVRGKGRGGFHGVAVAVEFLARTHGSGGMAWKARTAFKIPGEMYKWATSEWNSCAWEQARVVGDKGQMLNGMAREFPYESGARYVWAVDGGEFDGVFLRLVIGGEKC